MAKRKRKRKTTRRRSTSQSEYPGWVWMLFGLAVGLSVAYAIYQKYRVVPVAAVETSRQQPASMTAAIEPSADNATPSAGAEDDGAESRFTFYDMLPKFEVIIPDQEPEVSRDVGHEVIAEPGVYMLQAGSFTENADADRRRAELALLGIESRIQRVTIDDRSYHRVRIGPIENLDELNRVRSRLREARIDVLRIRISD